MVDHSDPTDPDPQDELSVVSDVFASGGEDTTATVEATAEPGPVMRYTQGGSPC
jgi:hypothetical protein